MVNISYKQLLCIFFLIGLIIFSNSFFNNFVWDDEELIVNNKPIHSILNIGSFFSGGIFNSGGKQSLEGTYYRPVQTTLYSLIITLFGLSPFIFHLIQTTLHIFNSFFIFLVLKKMTGKFFTSAVLAVIFLIHPINQEAVVYVADYQDVLFFFFGISALIVHLYRHINLPNLLFTSLLLTLGLLSKETTIVFIFLILIYDLLFKRRYLVKSLPFIFAPLLIYALLRLFAAGFSFSHTNYIPITQASFLERLSTLPMVVFYYLKTFFFPLDLSISQHWVVSKITLTGFILPIASDLSFFLSIIVLAIYLFKKNKNLLKYYIFYIFWFILGLSPHLQIIPLDQTVASRWFYLPIGGLLGILSVPLILGKAYLLNRRIIVIFLSLLIGILSVRTIIRNIDWKDGLTLYSKDIYYNPHSFNLQNNLGVEKYRHGKIEEAKKHFEISIDLAPQWWTNYNNLGVVYEAEQNYSQSKYYYLKSLEHSDYYLAYENLSKLYLYHESTETAKEFTKKALQKLPGNFTLWRNLAIAEDRLGNKEEALQAYKNSILLNPTKQPQY